MAHAEIIRKLFDAFNRHDIAVVVEFYAENAEVYDPVYPEPLIGRQAIGKDMTDTIRAFPDMRVSNQIILEKEKTIAGEYVMSGTNNGPLNGPDGDIPASGKKIRIGTAVFDRFNDQGKIIEERRYYNIAGMLEQIGLK